MRAATAIDSQLKARIERASSPKASDFLKRKASRLSQVLDQRRAAREKRAKDQSRLKASDVYAEFETLRNDYRELLKDRAELADSDRLMNACRQSLKAESENLAEASAEHAIGELSDVDFALAKARYDEAEQRLRQAELDAMRLKKLVPLRKRRFFDIELQAADRAAEMLAPHDAKIRKIATDLIKAVEEAGQLESDIERSTPRGRFDRITANGASAAARKLKRWLHDG